MHHKLLPNIQSNKEIDASCITAQLQLTPVSFTGRYKARGPSCGCLKGGEGSPARSVLPAAILPPSLPARPEPPPWGNGRVREGGGDVPASRPARAPPEEGGAGEGAAASPAHAHGVSPSPRLKVPAGSRGRDAAEGSPLSPPPPHKFRIYYSCIKVTNQLYVGTAVRC